MITQDSTFIELNRTFHELSQHAGKTDDIDLSQVFHVKNHLTWDDILKYARVVILSEAGSGKTREIRQTASRLRAEGKAAFFLRLELLPDDFEIAFEVGTAADFDAWLRSTDTGWFLLDSVDEARLRSPQDFERAIRKFGNLIETAKGRAYIVLTGRTHAWRPKTDFDLCERYISSPPQLRFVPEAEIIESAENETDSLLEIDKEVETEQQAEDTDPRFRMVALDDLVAEQVKLFATARGVNEPSKFMSEIERVDAWASTTRPQDLEDVISLWNVTGKIGGRLEIMRNSVDRRLSERDQQRAEAHPLSEHRAREGAMLLAAATTLAQTQIIRVPDGADNAKGLSAKSVLPDWNDRDISALLSRPIFDDAIYGTVRFHHRSVREYLTAEWIAKLLEKPASRRAIEDLFFQKQYGRDVIVPTMRPILPWLAIIDTRIRERVRAIAPEVIFEGGDPSALPLPTREEILAEVCETIALGSRVQSATEYSAVQRFAHSDIAANIRALLKQHEANDDVVGFLVRMIWLGRLHALVPEAKTIALSPSSQKYTRISAFRALREIGSVADQTDVRIAFVSESAQLNRELIGELATDLAPSMDAIDWLLSTTEKSEDKERYSVDRMADAVSTFCELIPLSLLPRFLSGSVRLLRQPPFIERGYCEVSKRFSWLMKAAAQAVERLIKANDLCALHEDALDVLNKFRAIREWDDEFRDIKVEYANLVPSWTELNDASFWHDIACTRAIASRKKDGRLTDYWQAQIFGAFWKFEADDFERVLSWIGSQPAKDDKLVALSLAFAIYKQNGRSRIWRERLKSACSGDTELADRVSLFLNPLPQDNSYRRTELRWKRQAAARAKKEAERFEKDREYIKTHVDEIRDSKLPNPADVSNVQWYLHQKMHEKRGDHTKLTDGRWRELAPMFGEDVAKAYRDGAMAYWRRYDPKLRSEGAIINSIPAGVIFGLSGLDIEYRENGLERLSPADAERAVKYALNEMNGFPSWFPNFYTERRDIARKVILGEIQYELATGTKEQDHHYVLADIAWSAQWTWDDLAPALLSMLDQAKPQNDSHLQQALKVIQASAIGDDEIARLASTKVGAGSTYLAQWYAVWVGVDPDKAISALSAYLPSIADSVARTDFAMQFVMGLWGGRHSETHGARSKFRTAGHLKALYTLMHEYIRVEEDIERTGGKVYSPTLRDDAQSARNRILEELNNIPGKEAFLALEEIALANLGSPSFSYLQTLSRRKAEQDADLAPWTATNVREFHDRQDRTPRTHRELAQLAVLRLLDLKGDLEEGDASVANIVKAVKEETVLRNYIGRELREKAFGRYSIPQEEEMADAKKPDLRFHGIGIDAPVPTELKIADNWTGPKLFERLKSQLAGDYLRDVRTGRGILVLVYRGEKSSWELPTTGQPVDFDGLIIALREYWASIASSYPGVDEIAIIGIDLTRRGK